MKALLPKIILIVVGLAVGVGGGVGGAMLLTPGGPLGPKKEAATPVPKPREPQPGSGIMLPMRERIVNLADPGIMRYLKTTVVLEIEEPGGKGEAPKGEEYKKKQTELMRDLAPQVTVMDDQITTILTSKLSTEIMTSDGKQKLRDELKARLNKAVHEPKVLAVYFTDFIVQ